NVDDLADGVARGRLSRLARRDEGKGPARLERAVDGHPGLLAEPLEHVEPALFAELELDLAVFAGGRRGWLRHVGRGGLGHRRVLLVFQEDRVLGADVAGVAAAERQGDAE